MSPIDWNIISPSASEHADTVHKGQDCVSVTIKEYDRLPWFVNPPVVVPAIDIVSNGEDFVGYFHKSQPINVADEHSTFKRIVACLEFLAHKHMALENVDEESFCYVSEEHACVLSPKCKVVNDPLLRSN